MRSNWLCEWKIVKSLITKIRIGMHTGPCVAGVVGTRMPRLLFSLCSLWSPYIKINFIHIYWTLLSLDSNLVCFSSFWGQKFGPKLSSLEGPLIKMRLKVLPVWWHSEHSQSNGEQRSPLQNPPQWSHPTGLPIKKMANEKMACKKPQPSHPTGFQCAAFSVPSSSVWYLLIIIKSNHLQLLAEFPGFQLEERGEMEIKGKGK